MFGKNKEKKMKQKYPHHFRREPEAVYAGPPLDAQDGKFADVEVYAGPPLEEESFAPSAKVYAGPPLRKQEAMPFAGVYAGPPMVTYAEPPASGPGIGIAADVCRKCGKVNPLGSNFCSKCGAPLAKDEA